MSGNFFSGLGVRPALGRTFIADDEKNHTQIAVLSYAYWSTRFNRDTQVIGQTLYVKAVPFTIVGVAAPGFTGLERKTAVDVWVPFQNRPDVKPWGASPQEPTSMYGSPDWFFLMTIGRLNPGMTEQQAREKGIEVTVGRAQIAKLDRASTAEQFPGFVKVLTDDAERLVVAIPEQRHKLLVRAQPQQRGPERDSSPRQTRRCWECRGFHLNPG